MSTVIACHEEFVVDPVVTVVHADVPRSPISREAGHTPSKTFNRIIRIDEGAESKDPDISSFVKDFPALPLLRRRVEISGHLSGNRTDLEILWP